MSHSGTAAESEPPRSPDPLHPGQVPDVVAPPPGNPRFPLFDGLRGVAALSVLVAHVSLISGANQHAWWGGIPARLDVSLTLFFVVSGFLLYRPFVAARMGGRPAPRVRDYARRRVLRVVPAYWLALTGLAIFPGLVGVFTEDWWIYYGFLQNYSPHTIVAGISQAWSLAIEASFYAALPVYAILAARLTRGAEPRRIARAEVLALGGLMLCVWASRVYAQEQWSGSTYPSTLAGTGDWLMIGMALAVVSAYLAGEDRQPKVVRFVVDRPVYCWLGAAAVLLILAYALGLPRGLEHTSTGKYLGQHVLNGVFAFLLVLPAVFGGHTTHGLPRRVLASRIVAFAGLISYGIFLWHLRLAGWLHEQGAVTWIPGSGFLTLLAATLALSIPIAAASYYFVERPILRFKYRGRRARPSGEPPPVASRQPQPPAPAEAGLARGSGGSRRSQVG